MNDISPILAPKHTADTPTQSYHYIYLRSPSKPATQLRLGASTPVVVADRTLTTNECSATYGTCMCSAS